MSKNRAGSTEVVCISLYDKDIDLISEYKTKMGFKNNSETIRYLIQLINKGVITNEK